MSCLSYSKAQVDAYVADYRVILENLKADPTRGDELVQSFIELRKTITSSWKNVCVLSMLLPRWIIDTATVQGRLQRVGCTRTAIPEKAASRRVCTTSDVIRLHLSRYGNSAYRIIDQSRVWQWGQEVDFLGERCAERIAELYPLCIVLDGDPPLCKSPTAAPRTSLM